MKSYLHRKAMSVHVSDFGHAQFERHVYVSQRVFGIRLTILDEIEFQSLRNNNINRVK